MIPIQKVVEIIIKQETGMPLTDEEREILNKTPQEEIEAIKDCLGL